MFKKVKITVKDKTYMQMLCNKIIEQNSDEKVIALVSSLLLMKIYSKENSLSGKGFIYIIVLGHNLVCRKAIVLTDLGSCSHLVHSQEQRAINAWMLVLSLPSQLYIAQDFLAGKMSSPTIEICLPSQST